MKERLEWNTEPRSEVLEAHWEKGREGCLVSLAIGRGKTCVMYLANEEEWAMAELSSDLSLAKEVFHRAWEGELSPTHLKNFCEDEKKRPEIFQ